MSQQKMVKKNVLLLGSGGFLGKNLEEFFSRNRDDLLIDKPDLNELNLLDESSVHEYLSKKRYDVIINAAVFNPKRAECANIPITELEADLRMFLNLQKCCHMYGKMYYFGSGAEFDKSKPICRVRECDFINEVPKNQYGLAKFIIGKLIESSKNIYNLRIFGLFGKYENWKSTFISGACCKAINDLPITIRQNVYFDYIFIDDFCKIINWFIDNEPIYHTYNVTSGRSVDLVSIAEMIKKVSKKDLKIIVCNDGLGNEYTASNERLVSEMGDSFYVEELEESIKKLYLYYASIKEQIDLYSLLYLG